MTAERRVRAVASQQDVNRLSAQMDTLFFAMQAMARDMEYISNVLVDAGILADIEGEPVYEEGPEPESEEEPGLLDQEYEVGDTYPPGFKADVDENDLSAWEGDGGAPEPDPEERAARLERIRAARERIRETSAPVDPDAEEEEPDLLDRLNTIQDVPEEGIVVLPARPEGDIS